MWVELLKTNFKDILQTLIHKPFIIIVLALMFSTGFFANKWVGSKDGCDIRISKIQLEKDSISSIAFDRLLLLYREQDLREKERRNTDSIIRSKLLEDKDNVEFDK